VLISQATDKLPFDIRDIRIVRYSRTALASSLRTPLARAVKQTLERYRLTGTRTAQTNAQSFAIAVTGTRYTDPKKVARALQELLTPYLDLHATWYCGVFGAVDEAAVEFLAGRRQDIAVVHFVRSSDPSIDAGVEPIRPEMQQLVQANGIRVITPTSADLTSVKGAPSGRDAFFTRYADLLILLWDGQSSNTRKMIEWYTQIGKNHIVGFM
jgi:hypothetical protein